jgi:hypothetical protein
MLYRSEWLLFNANSAIFQLFHGKNKLIYNDEVCFVLDQHAELDFYSASSLKQQSADKHVAPLWHIILIPSQPVFALSP